MEHPMRNVFIALTSIAALSAGSALAQDINDPAERMEARAGYMLMMAMNAATLGAMAKDETPYDAAKAKAAAANIASLAAVENSFLWVEGTDSSSNPDSAALPVAFTDPAGRAEKFAALKTAADAMVVAAGTDLASLKAGMAGLGGACAACHKVYRKPE
jgi:cytochrome c556